MLQAVKATDKFQSQLFQWDMKERIISLPHGKDIWFARLGEDGKFKIIDCKPKPQHHSKNKTK